jgi:tetratricopeptide (TPR) repeat protein
MGLLSALQGMQHATKYLSYHRASLHKALNSAFFPFLTVLLICLVYSNSFHCSWHFDDITNIINNQGLHLKELSPVGLKKALYADPGGPPQFYRPVACVTFALNHYFGGLDVFGYHAVNLFIHTISSLFLFLFIRGTLFLPALKKQYISQSDSIAFFATLLWALHPIQTQAITYIVQRMSSLAGMFFIIAMYSYLRFRTVVGQKEKISYLGLCIVSYLMGSGSKENAALLPASLFLYEILLVQREGWAWWRKRLGAVLTVMTAVLILLCAYLYYRKGGILPFIDEYANRPFSLTQRLLTESRILLFYISLLVYPVPWRFSVAHSVQISSSLFDPVTTFASILILLIGFMLLLFFAKKRPLVSFSFLFFFANHLMESTLLPLELVFEHRNYVPSMLFFVPVSLAIFPLIERYKSNKAISFAVSASLLLSILGIGYSTFLRNTDWKTPETLWMDAQQKAPDHLRVHHNLGVYFHQIGSLHLAKSHYEQALRSPVIHRRDEVIPTYYQLGLLHAQMGNPEEAKVFYREAVRRDPEFALALVNLASILDQLGDKAQADDSLAKALAVDPSNGPARLNIGIRYLREGSSEDAIFNLRMAMNDRSLDKNVLFYLGVAYKQKGLCGAAVLHLRKALALDPMNLTVRLHLIDGYLARGLEREARTEVFSLAGIIAQNQALLQQVLDLVSKGRDSLFVQPAASVIPLIHQALEENLAKSKLRSIDKNS